MATTPTKRSFLKFPSTAANRQVPFNFKVYPLRNDGYYFIGFNLFLPLTVLIITSLTLDRASTVFSAINLVSTLIGFAITFVYFNLRSPQKFTNSGLLIFYFFTFLPRLVSLIFSVVFQAADSSSQWLLIAEVWLQIAAEIIVIALAFKLTTNLKERFLLTLKNNWKLLLLISSLGVFLMWVASGLYALIFANTPLVGDSDNQNGLVKILNDPQSEAIKIFYIFTLFIFTVTVAPLAEELAFRHAWFVGSGARWIAFLTAPLYFGFLHVQAGDIEHILSYVISGLVLTVIFNYCQGNVVYSWLTHVGWNSLVLVLLLI